MSQKTLREELIETLPDGTHLAERLRLRDRLGARFSAAVNGQVRLPEISGVEVAQRDELDTFARWLDLVLADVAVIGCGGPLSWTSEVFLRTLARLKHSPEIVLLQIDGDRRAAFRNARRIQANGLAPRVFYGIEDGSRYLIARSGLDRRQREHARWESWSEREIPFELDLQQRELGMLHGDLTPYEELLPLQASLAEELQTASQQFERGWNEVERRSSLELEHFFQSGGPVMTAVEAELEQLIPHVTTSWNPVALKVGRLLEIATAAAMAAFLRELAAQAQRLTAEFGVCVPDLSPRLLVDPVQISRIPEPASMPMWSNFLSGFIKYFISVRFTEMVPRTKHRLIDGPVKVAEHGLGVVTAAENHRHSAVEHFRNEASLRVLPYLQTELWPVLRGAIERARDLAYSATVAPLSSRLREIEAAIERTAPLMELPADDPVCREARDAGLPVVTAACETLDRAAAVCLPGRIAQCKAEISELTVVVVSAGRPPEGLPFDLHDSAVREQLAEICETLSLLLVKRLAWPTEKARAAVAELQSATAEPGRRQPAARVQELLGLRVTYQRPERRGSWPRRSELFVAHDGRVVCVEHDTLVGWCNLPADVRENFIEDDCDTSVFLVP